MPLPLAPLGGILLRYGAVAIAGYALSRRVRTTHFDLRAEDAMDDVGEGLGLRRTNRQVNGAGRIRRVFRLGRGTAGLEVDVTALGRIRFRKV
jgi:hypothetical protein